MTTRTFGRPTVYVWLLSRLKKLHKNVNASLDRLEKFIFTEWAYSATRTSELHKWLKPSDQVDFNIEIKALSWPEYFNDLTQGARRYLSKENPKNLPAARGKDTVYVFNPTSDVVKFYRQFFLCFRLMVMHLALQGVLLSLIWYTTACVLGTTMSKTAFAVPAAYFLFSFL